MRGLFCSERPPLNDRALIVLRTVSRFQPMAPRKRAKNSTRRKSPKGRRFVHLPNEIIDHIATYVPSDDHRTLSNASRVCRVWSSVFLPHTFRHFEIGDSEGAAQELLEEIKKLPDMRLWIEELWVVGTIALTDGNVSHLFAVLSDLPRLSTFGLRNVHYFSESLRATVGGLNSVLQGCSSLREIIFKNFQSESHFMCALSSIPNLQSLSLSLANGGWFNSSWADPLPKIRLPALRSLKANNSLTMARFLLHYAIADQLQSIEISDDHESEEDWAVAIMSGTFPSLQSLNINANFGMSCTRTIVQTLISSA